MDGVSCTGVPAIVSKPLPHKRGSLARKALTDAENRVAATRQRILGDEVGRRYVCEACDFETEDYEAAVQHINEQRWHWVQRVRDPNRADRLIVDLEAAIRRYWSGEK